MIALWFFNQVKEKYSFGKKTPETTGENLKNNKFLFQ